MMKPNGPFIHKFQANSRKYIFDVYSSQILQVDDIVFDIVEDLGVLSKDEIIQKHGIKFGKGSVHSRLDFIRKIRKSRNLFSDFRPDRRTSNLKKETIKQKVSSHLKQVTLCITERCNLRCSYCVYSGKHPGFRAHTSKTMSWDIADRAIDYLISHSEKQGDHIALGFFGGEPLIEFELIKKCASKLRKSFKSNDKILFTITTNGTIINKNMLHFLVDNNVLLLISLDGPKQIHDANRRYAYGERGSYAKVMDTIKQIRTFSPDYAERFLSLSTTVLPPFDYMQLGTFFTSLAIPVRLNRVQRYGTPGFQDYKPGIIEDSSFENVRSKFIEAAIDGAFEEAHGRKKFRFLLDLFERPIKRLHMRSMCCGLKAVHTTGGLCVPGADKLFVNTDGSFYPCEKIEGNRSVKIGDVKQGVDINEVFNIISSFHNMGDNDCCDCWILKICHMCFAHVVHNHEFDSEKRRINCERLKNVYHHMLSVYCTVMEQNPKAFEYLENKIPNIV